MKKRVEKLLYKLGFPRSPEATTSLRESIQGARRQLNRIPREERRELEPRMRQLVDDVQIHEQGGLTSEEQRKFWFSLDRSVSLAMGLPHTGGSYDKVVAYLRQAQEHTAREICPRSEINREAASRERKQQAQTR